MQTLIIAIIIVLVTILILCCCNFRETMAVPKIGQGVPKFGTADESASRGGIPSTKGYATFLATRQ